jgi:hypothetical protein
MTFNSFAKCVLVPTFFANGTDVCTAACAQKLLSAQSLLLNALWKSLMVGGHDAPRKSEDFCNTIPVPEYPIRPDVRENCGRAGRVARGFLISVLALRAPSGIADEDSRHV